MLEFCRQVKDVATLTVTTNLTYPLDEAKMSILNLMSPSPDSRFEHFIQTSWDSGGVRWKKPSERDQFLANIQELRGAGFGIQGTVCVTKPLIEMYRDSESDLLDTLSTLFHYLNFERLTLNGNLLAHQELIPTFNEVDEFFLRLWKTYTHSHLDTPIRLLDDLVYSIINPRYWVGCRARKCSENVITINPNGSVSTCPNIAHEPNYAIVKFEGKNFKPLDTVRFEESIQKPDCLACDVFNICHGDCYQLVKMSGCHGLYKTIHVIVHDLEQNPQLRDHYSNLIKQESLK